MNSVIEAIKRRRSVRSYKDETIPRNVAKAVIDAGNWAPTGHNMQRWRFVVVEDEAFRYRLLAATRPTFRNWVKGTRDSTDEHHREYMAGLFSRCLGWDVARGHLRHRCSYGGMQYGLPEHDAGGRGSRVGELHRRLWLDDH